MTALSAKQKKEWAKSEYLHTDTPQSEIAEKVGVAVNTMSKWVVKENWKELKASITISREKEIQRFYAQIAELNKAISEREQGLRFATVSESNTLNNLAAAIKKLESETGITDIVNVSVLLVRWIRAFDLEKAKEVSTLIDAFIKETIKTKR